MPTRRPQLRRCRNCQKVGHNASTCASLDIETKPVILKTTSAKTSKNKISSSKTSPSTKKTPSSPSAPSLKFYVHHVNFEPRHSPHVVNLKEQKNNVWDQVHAVAPSTVEEESLYYFHHPSSSTEKIDKRISASQPETSEAAPLFVEFKHAESSVPTSDLVSPSVLPPSDKIKKWWSPGTYLSQKKSVSPVHSTSNIKKEFTTKPPSFSASSISSKSSFSLSRLFNRYFSFFSFSHRQPQIISRDDKPASLLPKITWSQQLLNRSHSFFNSFTNASILRKRLAFALAALLIISIVPTHVQGYYYDLEHTKQMVTDQSTNGFMSLQESTAALLSANLPNAEQSTINALQNFNAAVSTLQNNHQLLQKIISVVPVLKDEVQSRQKLIEAGQKISLGNTYLLQGLQTTENNTAQKPTDRLQTITNHLQAAIPNYEDALQKLNDVKAESLPPEFQAPFKDFKTIFTAAVNDFKQLSGLSQNFQEIFGGQGLRRYLVMFQNPDELRATGGFTGSFAVIDIKDGQLVKMEVPPGGTYDIQGQLDKYVEPPTPFLLFSKGYWQFQDANWFPDFPTSAQNIMWFYRHAGRGSVDGVISINSTVLTRLLALIGPVQDKQRGITLTSDNALATLRTVIDTTNETSSSTKPKQVISDLTPQFVDYFKNVSPTQMLPLLVSLKDALDQKEIQLYFTNQLTEEKITSFGWGGSISPAVPTQDYLNVNISNIDGGKTDAKIKQHITHQAVIGDDGSVIDTVVITRTHLGTAQETLFNRPNIAYFRVYVPEGSTLLSVSGVVQPEETAFHPPVNWAEKDELLTDTEKEVGNDQKTGTRITTEFGKTVFGNWAIVKPGETSQIQISYKLPFSLIKPPSSSPSGLEKLLAAKTPEIATYQLALQRQSGNTSLFESQIIFPTTWQPLWNEGTHLDLAANGATISSTELTHDMIWSLAMQKKN